MPSYLLRQRSEPQGHTIEHDPDHEPQVFITPETENTVSELHQTFSRPSPQDPSPPLEDFEKYLQRDEESKPRHVPLSVCFKSVTTYGKKGGPSAVKTLQDAIWRTLTCQDIYEGTLKRLISPERVQDGTALIRDFSGVVRNGQMMLVLGNPGSGCSTFLRTISGEHASFLGVNGSLDYSGLSLGDISKRYRGAVAYIPEDDIHLPTLTVRQTLEFALKSKTPKRLLHEVPRFLREYGRVFGMTHVMDTLVGNEFIRGVSGGERKRVSILESLASDSSLNCWDGSTRGLDAASALDYIRSLRIMTDTCDRATVVSLYQASDAIYDLMDKLLLIDQGRMLYQGPASEAESYFGSLGYRRLPRQTMSDFLTNVAAGNAENIAEGHEKSAPRGAENLERAFRASGAFDKVKREIAAYEADFHSAAPSGSSANSAADAFTSHATRHKSRFVSARSPYNTSFVRQALLATQREFWQLRGHPTPFVTRALCIFVCAFLLGSMFYMMPADTAGVYSRGGFAFYAATTVAWFQMGELETAFHDRTVTSRQRRFAMVRPSAVVVGKATVDVVLILVQSAMFSLIAYFLAGMRNDAGAFFAFVFSIFFCGMAYTSLYRVLGAASPRLEIALRYTGLFLLVAVIFGGYVRPVSRLISDVPWVGWLAYTTPVLYAFEIIMAMEFHGREFPCAADAIIPSGSAYTDQSYQTCAYKGMSTGQLGLQGDAYITDSFGFKFSNVGRDFGILILFFVAFLLLNMWLVEKIDWADGTGGSLEFARETPRSSVTADEESAGKHETPVNEGRVSDSPSDFTDQSLVKSRSTFTWRNLQYSIAQGAEDKQLLRDVSGFLMTVLTQQATGKLQGEMKVDGKNVDASFGQAIGYCQQMDIHIETSTVREAFEFSALLRQPRSTSKADKLAYVNTVLGILQMSHLQHATIRSLSLEQKKRTTIGVELCAKPSMLLFLDEPTSGLDGQGAMSIVRLLRRLANNGQAIICTIHQASQEQFELFDRALALKPGGQVYYFGDVGPKGKTVLDYFTRHGVAADPDKNVADLLIDVTARGSPDAKHDWCGTWDASPEAAAVLRRIDAITSETHNAPGHDAPNTSSFASSTLQQTYHLTKRTFTQYWRTPDYIYSRLYCSFFHAGLNGLAFLQLGNSVDEMQYRVFSCFLVLMIVPEFINACAMMFDENRNVWLGREYPSRVYGWTAFTTAQVVAEIPYAAVGSVIFYVLMYFLVGLPLGAPAGYTFLMMVMFHLFTTSWGQWIAALSSDAAMAANIMPFFLIMCEFFNGVIQPQYLMPVIWRYTMYYVGPFTYWISGIVAMILSPITVYCRASELSYFEPPPNSTCGEYASTWLSGTTGYLDNPDATSSCGYCQYEAGQDYLSTLGVAVPGAWPCLGIFALFTVTNYLSVYVMVYFKSVKNWFPW